MRRFLCATILLFLWPAGSIAQLPKTLSVIGSSTSACFGFGGGISDANCYVNRVVNYYNSHGYTINLHNLAVSGTNIYNGMPSGSPSAMIGSGTYNADTAHNITKAISFAPDAIIVNFPTNQYDVGDVHAILSYFRAVKKNANDSGRVCFVTTTQPRSNFDATARAKLKELKDSILLQFGSFAINFWDVLANPDGTINPIYGQGDGIHLNAVGHDTLAQRVIAKNIFAVPCINRTLASGNWDNSAIWDKGSVPGICDSVVILSGHSVTLNVSSQVKTLYVSAGGTLSISANITFDIGEAALFNKDVTIDGTLNISAGTASIAGRLRQGNGSTFTMSGGLLLIKGNSGTAGTSVADGKHLFDISASAASFSFTAGTLQVVDPPLGSSSQAINCPFSFGNNTTLKFGDGVSTLASNNINGFGGNLLPAQVGRLVLDAVTSLNNRIFTNLNTLTVTSPLQVLSGQLVQGAALNINN